MNFNLYYTKPIAGKCDEIFALEGIALPSVRAAVAHARHRFGHLIYPAHSCVIVWKKDGVLNHHIVKNTKEA